MRLILHAFGGLLKSDPIIVPKPIKRYTVSYFTSNGLFYGDGPNMGDTVPVRDLHFVLTDSMDSDSNHIFELVL